MQVCKQEQASKVPHNRPVPEKKRWESYPPYSKDKHADGYTHSEWIAVFFEIGCLQNPQEQRFATIFTTFWVSFGCFDLRFSAHHKQPEHRETNVCPGFYGGLTHDDCLVQAAVCSPFLFFFPRTLSIVELEAFLLGKTRAVLHPYLLIMSRYWWTFYRVFCQGSGEVPWLNTISNCSEVFNVHRHEAPGKIYIDHLVWNTRLLTDRWTNVLLYRKIKQ